MIEQVDLPAEWFNAPKALIHATGLAGLSTRQNRLMMIIAGALHAKKFEPVETKVKFSIAELMENYPSNERRTDKLYEDLKSVKNTGVESVTRDKDTGDIIHAECASFLGSVALDAGTGFVNLTVPSMMMAMIHTPDAWGTINKTAWLQINSKHSQRLYQLIADQHGKGKRISRRWAVELDEFIILMQIPEAGDGSYRSKATGVFSFGGFNKHVLKPALAEINAMGIFKVELEAKRRGRNVRRLFFTWEPKIGIPACETAKDLNGHSVAKGKKQTDNSASPLTDGQAAFAWWEMLTDIQKGVQMERYRFAPSGKERPIEAIKLAAWTAHNKEQSNE